MSDFFTCPLVLEGLLGRAQPAARDSPALDRSWSKTPVSTKSSSWPHIGRHPLSHFAFDGNGDLLVNVGAATDQCTDRTGAPMGATCPESEGDDARAVIRRYRYLGGGQWDRHPTRVGSEARRASRTRARRNHHCT